METFKAPEGKWGVQHGIHRGTITSRDSGYDEFDSEDEAREFFSKQLEFYRRIGYSIWFAYLIDDQGSKVVLAPSVPYR